MLILSRKSEESIVIGDSITIKILGIHEGQVKIGITAPKDIKVYRTEVYEQIQQENLEASKAEKGSLSEAATLLRTKHPRIKDARKEQRMHDVSSSQRSAR